MGVVEALQGLIFGLGLVGGCAAFEELDGEELIVGQMLGLEDAAEAAFANLLIEAEVVGHLVSGLQVFEVDHIGGGDVD